MIIAVIPSVILNETKLFDFCFEVSDGLLKIKETGFHVLPITF